MAGALQSTFLGMPLDTNFVCQVIINGRMIEMPSSAMNFVELSAYKRNKFEFAVDGKDIKGRIPVIKP